jgi:HlyD family secretion protein
MINNSTGPLLLTLLAAACTARADNPPGYQGVVELEERVLGFEVPGRLRARMVDRGDLVAADQVLAELDDALAVPARDARAAELRAAQAQLALLEAGARSEDVRGAEAQRRAAAARVTQLARNLETQRRLAGQGASTAGMVDDLADQLAQARQDETALEQRVRLLRNGARPEEVEAARARVQGAEAALAAESLRLDRHRLRGDRAGTVVEVHVEPGEIVAAGTPVITVADLGRPFVDVFVPEAEIAKVKLGDRARVRVDGAPDGVGGLVEDIARTTEFTPRFLFSPRERPNLVVRVRVRIDDPEQRLRAGMPAFVALERGAP